MKRLGFYTAAALLLSIGYVSAQTAEDRKTPVRAKEPTVVTVHGKSGQVALDKSALKFEEKKPNLAKRMLLKVGRGIGHAWNAAFDWTEDSLGVKDDTDSGKERQTAK